MKRGATGTYEDSTLAGETVHAFIPYGLPPKPSLPLDGRVRERLDAALIELGRLDGVSSLLPNVHLFLYIYVRKEAVLSSQIEGNQSTLSDLLLFELKETPGVPIDDVVEVSNYVRAMEHGLKRIRGGLPISNRLFREMHEVLLSRGRGAGKAPGEFRRTQNWIGGTRPGNALFVPPPPPSLQDTMGALERFLHDEKHPTLLKAGLAHVQFETIHPFLDGNGRLGRLLITLLLCAEGLQREPILYLSLHFKRHRTRYYELLDGVRKDGDWESWVEFFADGVAETAQSAVKTARRLLEIAERDRARIEDLGRAAGSAEKVHQSLQSMPLCTAARLVRRTKLTLPTVLKALGVLERLGVVHEVTGKKRHRVFHYDDYMKVLNEGTEPL